MADDEELLKKDFLKQYLSQYALVLSIAQSWLAVIRRFLEGGTQPDGPNPVHSPLKTCSQHSFLSVS